jgi:hypothetical protein
MLKRVKRGLAQVDEASELSAARAALVDVSARTSQLLASLPDTGVPIPGSTWTVREAAVHLSLIGFHYAGMAHGEPNQHSFLAPDACARRNDELNADIPESDPGALADLVREGTHCLLAATASRKTHEDVGFPNGNEASTLQLVAVAVAEHLLHGYDMAFAAKQPWLIDPCHAALGLYGYRSSYQGRLSPGTTAAHTASYGVELIGNDGFTVRFTDGHCRLDRPDSGPVDCMITADPVALLLVESGRMSQWAAIALGLIRAHGDRPELAPGFTELFVFP